MLSKSRRINTSLAVSAVLLTTILGQTILTNNTNAAGDSASTNASVVLNPTISLTLSSSDLTISSLNPSSHADSNSIDISVSTNVLYGYYLSATAGDGNTSSTNHNNYLTNTANSDYKFTSLSSNKASLTNFDDGTWGYSYSRDNGSTWISGSQGATLTGYNGLPTDNDDNGATGIALISTDSPTNNNSVKFKIGAKSSPTQAAGTYTNTINFYAVTNPEPDNTLQGFAAGNAITTCSAMSVNDTITLKDSRDNQEYTIAKLKDGRCWMTENLNIAGSTALSTDDTDVTSDYIESFTTSNNLTKTGNTIVLPTSSASGFNDYYSSFVYNSGKKTNCGAYGQIDTSCYSYYSWDAATLGSGRSITTNNTDAEQSICPKGWKLPTSRTNDATNWNTISDFYILAHQYGLDSTTSTTEYDGDFVTQAGPGTTPNFLLAGYYNSGGLHSSGVYGFYWSSTSQSGTYDARYLYFYSNNVNTADSGYRNMSGLSVRCLLR